MASLVKVHVSKCSGDSCAVARTMVATLAGYEESALTGRSLGLKDNKGLIFCSVAARAGRGRGGGYRISGRVNNVPFPEKPLAIGITGLGVAGIEIHRHFVNRDLVAAIRALEHTQRAGNAGASRWGYALGHS